MVQDSNIIKPEKSRGWIVPAVNFAIFFVSLLIMIIVVINAGLPNSIILRYIIMIIIGILAVITLYVFAIIIIFFSMKYVVLNDRVILRCGWYKKDIIFSQIEKVEIDNIKANLLADSYSPIKFPGYALGRVYTFDKGLVYMCATRVNKNILLIYLKNGEKVGITPKNIEGFKEFLIGKARVFQEEE